MARTVFVPVQDSVTIGTKRNAILCRFFDGKRKVIVSAHKLLHRVFLGPWVVKVDHRRVLHPTMRASLLRLKRRPLRPYPILLPPRSLDLLRFVFKIMPAGILLLALAPCLRVRERHDLKRPLPIERLGVGVLDRWGVELEATGDEVIGARVIIRRIRHRKLVARPPCPVEPHADKTLL